MHEAPTSVLESRPSPRALDHVFARALAKDGGTGRQGELVASARRSSASARPGACAETAPSALRLPSSCLRGAPVAIAVITTDIAALAFVAPKSVGVIDPASNGLVVEVPRQREATPVPSPSVRRRLGGERRGRDRARIGPATRERGRTIPSALPHRPRGRRRYDLGRAGCARPARVSPEQNVATDPIAAIGEDTGCELPPRAAWRSAPACLVPLENGELGRIDPAGGKAGASAPGRPAHLCPVPSASYADIAYGLESLWIVNRARTPSSRSAR